jgi:hypothetical protein
LVSFLPSFQEKERGRDGSVAQYSVGLPSMCKGPGFHLQHCKEEEKKEREETERGEGRKKEGRDEGVGLFFFFFFFFFFLALGPSP